VRQSRTGGPNPKRQGRNLLSRVSAKSEEQVGIRRILVARFGAHFEGCDVFEHDDGFVQAGNIGHSFGDQGLLLFEVEHGPTAASVAGFAR